MHCLVRTENITSQLQCSFVGSFVRVSHIFKESREREGRREREREMREGARELVPETRPPASFKGYNVGRRDNDGEARHIESFAKTSAVQKSNSATARAKIECKKRLNILLLTEACS